MELTVGFVYVLTNAAMPGLVKVGMSKHLAEDRARGLTTTGVPLPFEVVHRCVTSHPRDVERRAHHLLAGQRLRSNREFFKVGPATAVEAVQQASIDAAGIRAWDTSEPVKLQAGDRVALTLSAGQILVALPYRRHSMPPSIIDIWEAPSDGDSLELMATDRPEYVGGFGVGDPGGEVDPVPYVNRTQDAPNGFIIGKERLDPGQRLLWLDDTGKQPACNIALFEFHAFCQVVCRTWHPRVTEDGLPVLLNFVHREPSPTMIAVIRAAAGMAPPTMTPPPPDQAQEPAYGTVSADASYWLSQLRQPTRRPRRRSSDR